MSTILSSDLSVPPYSYMLSAQRAFEAAGLDFPKTFNYFFDNGWVCKGPDHFMMLCVDFKDPDAWLVYWAESHSGNLLATLFQHMPYYKPRIVWCRPFRGRAEPKYYSTDRLLSRIRKTSATS